MKKITRYFTALTAAVCVLALFSVSCLANSMPSRWLGSDTSEVIITDGECPLQVEKELLTFHLDSLPEDYYGDKESLAGYDASVTAEYTVYNPADYEITATLLFPFGFIPDYIDFESAVWYEHQSGSCEVRLDGTVIPATVRHTVPSSYLFDIKNEAATLLDSYADDDFLTPELTVHKITYTASGIEEPAEGSIALDASFTWEEEETMVVNGAYYLVSPGEGKLHHDLKNGSTHTYYIIGELPEGEPVFRIYNSKNETASVNGRMEETSRETLTFEEFALTVFDNRDDITDTDKYNLVVNMLKDDTVVYLRENMTFTRWYEYEITVGPKERVTNTVKAPMYPTIDYSAAPSVYDYTYLLSPAKEWSSFGSLDIIINTPYYITDSSISGFEKSDNGYTLSLNGLPSEELQFSLCTVESPQYELSPYGLAFIAMLIVSIILVIIAITVSVIIFKRIRKKSK